MNGRRALTAVVSVSAVSGALGLLAGQQTWVSVTVQRADPLPPSQADVAGAALAPLVPGLALVVLAAAVALLATRGLARIAVGVAVAASGGGLLAASLPWVGGPDADAAVDAADLPAGTATASAAFGPWLGVTAGVLAVLVGLLAVLRSRTWPGMGARYDAPTPAAGTRTDTATGTEAGTAAADLTERQVWDALDRGEDPTQGADRAAERRAYSHPHHGPTTRGTGNQ